MTVVTSLTNLTPHAINIVAADGSAIATVAPSGTVARCATVREFIEHIIMLAPCPDSGSVEHDPDNDYHCGYCGGEKNRIFPVYRTKFGPVEGLPDPQPGARYIVSSLVAQAAKDRTDLVIPDDTVRDAEGRIIGCRAFGLVREDRSAALEMAASDLHNAGWEQLPQTGADLERLLRFRGVI